MSIPEETKAKIKQNLDEVFNALNKKKTNTTDCDWIFDDCKEMIIEAVNHKASLSAIVKALTTSTGRFVRNVIDKKTNEKKQKDLKITVQKLAKWLKAQGIEREIQKRKVHRRKKTGVQK